MSANGDKGRENLGRVGEFEKVRRRCASARLLAGDGLASRRNLSRELALAEETAYR